MHFWAEDIYVSPSLLLRTQATLNPRCATVHGQGANNLGTTHTWQHPGASLAAQAPRSENGFSSVDFSGVTGKLHQQFV